MLTRVCINMVAFVLGILFLTLLHSDVQAQSRNRLSIRNRHESAQSTSKGESEHLPALANATSDRQMRQQVGSEILSIPGMTQDDLYRIQTVLNSVSVFRRLPIYQIEVDKSMIMFMVNNPDSVVNIWDKLGISQITVKRRDNNLYSISDVAGTSGMMKKIWSSDNGVLYYLEGSYKGPMISRRIKGRALILARFATKQGESGTENVVCYVDTFLSLEQEFFDAGVKLLFPMFGRVADNNLEQTLIFVKWYSDGCKSTPISLAAFAMELDDVPYETRQELARQTILTAQRNGNSEIVLNAFTPVRSVSHPNQDSLAYSSSSQTLAQTQPYQVNYPPVEEQSYTPMEPALLQFEPIDEQLQPTKSESITVDSDVEQSIKSESTQTESVTQNRIPVDVPDVDTSMAPALEETEETMTEVTKDTLEEQADSKSDNQTDESLDMLEVELEPAVTIPEIVTIPEGTVQQENVQQENPDKQTGNKRSNMESEPEKLPDALPDDKLSIDFAPPIEEEERY